MGIHKHTNAILMIVNQNLLWVGINIIPRPLQDFVLWPWRKIPSYEIKSGSSLGMRLSESMLPST